MPSWSGSSRRAGGCWGRASSWRSTSAIAGRAGTTPNGCSTASPTATSTSPRRRFSMTIAGHAKLAAQSPIRICGAEAAATRFEIREWLERGGVSVVQPNIGRGGGLTEIRRIAELCELHGAEVIPHGWKTGITSAVGRHFQEACPAAPLFEYVSPKVFDSPLRRELVSPEPVLRDGFMALPTAPGLGIELNEELVERWRIDRR